MFASFILTNAWSPNQITAFVVAAVATVVVILQFPVFKTFEVEEDDL
jgi:hypothetical protein